MTHENIIAVIFQYNLDYNSWRYPEHYKKIGAVKLLKR